jgi:hypothetical protein
MTLIGKFLVFLNLIVGVGVAVISTAVYTERPTWFDTPEGSDKGPFVPGFTFAQMKTETDSLGRAVVTANKAWGESRDALEKAEALRDDRKAKLDARLAEAHKTGIFELVRDPETKMVDADKKGPAVVGPDGDPLRGADTLLELPGSEITRAKTGLTDLAKELADLRVELVKKIEERDLLESQRRKQVAIRETVLNELYFLRDFGVNWDEERDTVTRRKRQLDTRIQKLMGK